MLDPELRNVQKTMKGEKYDCLLRPYLQNQKNYPKGKKNSRPRRFNYKIIEG